MSDEDALTRLAAVIEHEGGLLGAARRERDPRSPAPTLQSGDELAVGPRTHGHERDYEFVLEAIREGYLLHYGTARLVSQEDPDLALLIGDRLYALGLAELVELGDVDAVTELADLTSLCAIAHTTEDAELAEAAWEAAQTAIGWGTDEHLARAQRLARSPSPGVAEQLRSASHGRRR